MNRRGSVLLITTAAAALAAGDGAAFVTAGMRPTTRARPRTKCRLQVPAEGHMYLVGHERALAHNDSGEWGAYVPRGRHLPDEDLIRDLSRELEMRLARDEQLGRGELQEELAKRLRRVPWPERYEGLIHEHTSEGPIRDKLLRLTRRATGSTRPKLVELEDADLDELFLFTARDETDLTTFALVDELGRRARTADDAQLIEWALNYDGVTTWDGNGDVVPWWTPLKFDTTLDEVWLHPEGGERSSLWSLYAERELIRRIHDVDTAEQLETLFKEHDNRFAEESLHSLYNRIMRPRRPHPDEAGLWDSYRRRVGEAIEAKPIAPSLRRALQQTTLRELGKMLGYVDPHTKLHGLIREQIESKSMESLERTLRPADPRNPSKPFQKVADYIATPGLLDARQRRHVEAKLRDKLISSNDAGRWVVDELIGAARGSLDSINPIASREDFLTTYADILRQSASARAAQSDAELARLAKHGAALAETQQLGAILEDLKPPRREGLIERFVNGQPTAEERFAVWEALEALPQGERSRLRSRLRDAKK